MISIIVAASRNNVIGRNGLLPWKLSDDLRHFKATTLGKPVIMGRKTWESIGRPLPGRQNIVITRQRGFVAKGCDVAASVDAAIALAGQVDEIMVIGGTQVYEAFLPRAERLYVTRVHAVVEGDAFFPAIDEDRWKLLTDELHWADEKNDHAFSFRIYERVADRASASRSANS